MKIKTGKIYEWICEIPASVRDKPLFDLFDLLNRPKIEQHDIFVVLRCEPNPNNRKLEEITVLTQQGIIGKVYLWSAAKKLMKLKKE